MVEKDFTISKFQSLVDDFVKERGWKRYHIPKDLAISVSIESAELLELFQWDRQIDQESKKSIAEELADIMIYCAAMANATEIMLSEAIMAKIEKNSMKYPADKVRGATSWDDTMRRMKDE